MKNLSKKTVETIGVDYVRFVNSNYGDLLKSYFDADPEDINFPTWCMVMYTENYPKWQVNVQNQGTISSDELTQTV